MHFEIVGAEESRGGVDKGSPQAEEGGGVPVQAGTGAQGAGNRAGGEGAQHHDPTADHGESQTQDQEGEIQKESPQAPQVRRILNQ